MVELDRSASRGEMRVCGLWAFEHSSYLGNAPSHKLLAMVQVAPEPAARAFNPARVTAPPNGAEVLSGVRFWNLA